LQVRRRTFEQQPASPATSPADLPTGLEDCRKLCRCRLRLRPLYLALGPKPILQIVTVSPSTLLVEFVRALLNLKQFKATKWNGTKNESSPRPISPALNFSNLPRSTVAPYLLIVDRIAMGDGIALPQPKYPIQRRWTRYTVDVPVRLITHRPTKVAIAEGRGSELNCGGMTVYAGVELSAADQVEVEFTPPYSGTPIRVRCFVRSRHGYTYGVEFITENDTDYESVGQIESILKSMGTPTG